MRGGEVKGNGKGGNVRGEERMGEGCVKEVSMQEACEGGCVRVRCDVGASG